MSEVRRGWLLILASTFGVACSSVVLPYYSIGALVGPLTQEYDWTRSEVQLAILFSSGLGVLTAPLVGMLSDRYGPRALVLPCLLGLGVGFFIAAASNGHLYVLYFAYIVMAIAGAGTTPITWTRAIASAFDKQRGLALGLTLTGTGVCAMAAPIYTVWLVEEFGWRVAYVGLGLLPIVLAGPIVFLGFKPPRVAEQKFAGAAAPVATNVWGLSLAEAVRSYKFWVLCVSIFAVYLAMSGITPNLIPAMTDKGLTPSAAARIQGLLGIAIILGRVVVGVLVDRFWAPGVALVSLLLPVAGCLIISGTTSPALIYLSVLLIGFAAGAELDLMAFLVSRYFGLRHYAKIYSIMYALLAFGSGTAPTFFAMVYDATQSYDASFYAAAALFFIGAVVVVVLGRYPVQSAPAAAAGADSSSR